MWVVLVGAVVLLSFRRPALALAIAVLMMGFEGSIKALLALEHPMSGLPGGFRAFGAAGVDLALGAATVGVLVADRGRTAQAIWSRLGRGERVMLGMLGAWWAISALQLPPGDTVQGLEGFRLFQAYVPLALAAAVVFSVPAMARRGTVALLVIGLCVSLYAVVRVVAGPALVEILLANSSSSTNTYGGSLRAIGSFSSAFGLTSYLLPVAFFALVLGLLVSRLRLLAWIVAGLSIVGLGASFARGPIYGIAIALVCVLAVLLAATDISRAHKAAAVAFSVVALAAAGGAVVLLGHHSPELRARSAGIVNPIGDPSFSDRWNAWSRAVDDVVRRPFGSGVGTVGASSTPAGRRVRTTDNSFLKVFVDQGIVGGLLFLVGVVGTAFLLLRRLARMRGEARAIGLAAVTGFIAFLGLALTGEYVEAPGKVIAWTLLGIGFAQATIAPPPPPEPERPRRQAVRTRAPQIVRRTRA
jgi:O-Antigen ligase